MPGGTSELTAAEIEKIQATTGVDVIGLIERLKKTPDERLRRALEGARNLARLRESTEKVPPRR
jgi:adenylosuccinate lyase